MASSAALTPRTWRRPPRIPNPAHRVLLLVAILGYAAVALWTVRIDPARMAEGLGRAGTFFGGVLRPDFTTRWVDIRAGFAESLAMTVVSTAVGLLLAIPLGLGAA
jgi:phosphonate transport system permease protein